MQFLVERGIWLFRWDSSLNKEFEYAVTTAPCTQSLWHFILQRYFPILERYNQGR